MNHLLCLELTCYSNVPCAVSRLGDLAVGFSASLGRMLCISMSSSCWSEEEEEEEHSRGCCCFSKARFLVYWLFFELVGFGWEADVQI